MFSIIRSSFGLEQLAFISLFWIISCLFLILRRTALGRARVSMRATGQTALAAYLTFARANTRLLYIQRRFLRLFCVGLTAIFFFSTIVATDQGTGDLLMMLQLFVAGLFIGLLVRGFLTRLLGCLLVDRPAMLTFGQSALESRVLIRLQFRELLVSFLPLLIYLEAVGTGLTGDLVSSIVIGLVFFALWTTLYQSFSARIVYWTTSSYSLADSAWAHLEARIRGWAALAHVELGDIRVCRSTVIGGAGIWLHGFERNRVLFISEPILSFTEWRQQDALVCSTLVISGHRRAIDVLLPAIGMPLVVGLFVASISVIVNLVTTNLGMTSPTMILLISLLLLLPVITIFVFVTRLLLYLARKFLGYRPQKRGTYTTGKQQQTNTHTADYQACWLTGDPAGLIIAIHTGSSLNGLEIEQRGIVGAASSQRIQALLAEPAWPLYRAPYVETPIPCIVPVSVGPRLLTTSFADPQLPLADLPAIPYYQQAAENGATAKGTKLA